MELMDMQFVLSRIVNLPAAGGTPDLREFDDDPDADAPLMQPAISDWLSSVGSSSVDEDDELISEFPPPVSLRKTQPQTHEEISQDDSTTA